MVIISEADKKYLKNVGAKTDSISVIPVAVRDDICEHKEDAGDDDLAICFLGKMSYQPNIDAVTWFSKYAFPALREKYQNLVFYIIGIEPTKEVLALNGNGIVVTGFVENPYEIIKHCMAMVVPIRNGAGMQNKILESMVVGTPCVITSIAEEGLNGISGRDYIVANSGTQYVKAIENLIEDVGLRKKISCGGSSLVQRYTWSGVLDKYRKMMDEKSSKKK